jgi:hypothetical protein
MVTRGAAAPAREEATLMPLPSPYVASLPTLIRARLAQARRERGVARLYSLALVSQMLRELLDAADQRLQTLLDRAEGRDHAVPDPPPTPQEIAAVFADIADSAAQLIEDASDRPPGA